jgi:predicted peptidase
MIWNITMTSRREFLATGAGAAVALAAQASCAQPASAAIKSATAITEVFGDGQKLTVVALEYDQPIDGSKLSAASFQVEGRTITGVHASASAAPSDRAASGKYVIVELSPNDPGAALKVSNPGGGGGGPPSGGGPPAGGGPPRMSPPVYKPAKATIVQTGPVVAVGGKAYAASSAGVTTSRVSNLIVDDFQPLEFHDPKTGDTLKYNLFTPKGYDPKKAYPLVLFMHDAGVTGPEVATTLRQGLGAVVFASPEAQAKHPCFVLAPQFSRLVANDASETTSDLDTTIDLINDLAGRFSLDRKRLYTTGQSGGAMMSLAMDIKYPTFFAASYIVAGQWDPEKCKPLATQKLWIVVAEGDLKAFPGQNAITAVLEKQGAKISRAVWDGRWTPEQFAPAVAAMAAQGAAINYAVLQKGTVVPPGQADNGGGNHVNTWRIAYTIEGVRDWLFQQSR